MKTPTLPPSLAFANLPTPLQFLSHWSQRTAPLRLWLKRDDLTGILLSGNKVRKLEFLLREALDRQAQVLITCGGLQSNHARTTAALSARMGLKCHLVLKGKPEETSGGNFFLDRLLGAKMTFITPQEYATASNQIMEQIAADYQAKGLQPYIIPEGASCPLGAFGYARAIEEIKKQSAEAHIEFDAIVCATGSGGTQAGLILGSKLFDFPVPIFGINICDDAVYFQKKITDILNAVHQQFFPHFSFSPEDIRIIDGYVGEGYGKATAEELFMLQEFARSEGIVLEPVYTGKALYGLMQEMNDGRFAGMKNILFIHTGGIFGLFPYHHRFDWESINVADGNER